MAAPGCVGIVLGVRPVGDHKNLHVFIQPGSRPKAVPLIAFDLTEGLSDRHTASLELQMDEGQAVHKNGHIITGAVRTPVFLVLVDDLQAVVVDVFFIQQTDVFCGAIVAV